MQDKGFPGDTAVKESACLAGDTGETQVRSLGQEDPLEKEMAAHSQDSCLENPWDGGSWGVTVHRVAKN